MSGNTSEVAETPPVGVYPANGLPPRPDISHLVTEDDTPVDNLNSERNMRLLVDTLCTSWKPERDFVAMANVGLFYQLNSAAVVPDMLLSMDVKLPVGDPWKKENRSYFVWEYGKPPDVVVEIVSNTEGGELDRKMKLYARVGVRYYAVFDPYRHLLDGPLVSYVLHGGRYQLLNGHVFEELGLQLMPWTGSYQGYQSDFVRWADLQGTFLPTGEEAADVERERANAEQQRADAERERANAETQRADEQRHRADAEQERAIRLAAKLKALGVDPESV